MLRGALYLDMCVGGVFVVVAKQQTTCAQMDTNSVQRICTMLSKYFQQIECGVFEQVFRFIAEYTLNDYI